MSDLMLSTDGDLLVTNNALMLNSGREAIRQHLEIRLRTFLGEWFLDTDVGVPWYRDILGKNPQFVLISQILKGVVLDTPGVTELTAFSLEYKNTRELSVSFKCETTEGEIVFSEPVEV